MTFIASLQLCIRFIVQLYTFLWTLILLQLPGTLILLIVCAFYDIGKLPKYLRWYDSADPFIGRDISVITRINTEGYWSKYCWLAWRNPVNYFGYVVQGYLFKGVEKYTIKENLNVGDSTEDVPGLKIIELDTGIYEYAYIHKWSQTTCLRLRFGWKIGDLSNKPGFYIQRCFVIQPYKSYSGL